MKLPNNISDDCPIVYILGNRAMTNYFKIGKTIKRNILRRVKDLSSKTSVPTPFDLLGVIIDNYGNGYDLESNIFDKFKSHRVSSNREFFFFENSDDLLTMDNLLNKKIIWNDVHRINYSKTLTGKNNLKYENKYVNLIKRREKVINDLFARRHTKEIRTNSFIENTVTINNKESILDKLKSMVSW